MAIIIYTIQAILCVCDIYYCYKCCQTNNNNNNNNNNNTINQNNINNKYECTVDTYLSELPDITELSDITELPKYDDIV